MRQKTQKLRESVPMYAITETEEERIQSSEMHVLYTLSLFIIPSFKKNKTKQPLPLKIGCFFYFE